MIWFFFHYILFDEIINYVEDLRRLVTDRGSYLSLNANL